MSPIDLSCVRWSNAGKRPCRFEYPARIQPSITVVRGMPTPEPIEPVGVMVLQPDRNRKE